MTKGVQLWPGNSMRAFYRRHIVRETSLDAAATERLVEALTKATNRMLVWDMPQEVKSLPAVPAAPAPAPAAVAVPTKADKKTPEKGKPSKATKAEPLAPAPVPAPEPEKPFDPYAFSAMVVLAKQGKDALVRRFAEITSVENLKKLADAQHLGFDRSLTKIDDVRKALLAATEQRLADRRAAAS